jgi:uncharacterized protein YdiU (UPF0061 family)
MRGSGGTYRILVGKPEGRTPFGRQGIDGRLILKSVLLK